MSNIKFHKKNTGKTIDFEIRGQLHGAPGLHMMEQLLLEISNDEVMKYKYLNTTLVE